MLEICRWFARCANETTTALSHPILGLVPCCTRCATKVGAEAELLPLDEYEAVLT